MKTILLSLLILTSFNASATRNWIGNQPVIEIQVAKNSGNCGADQGSCLLLFFADSSLTKCSAPESNFVAISLEEPFIDEIKSAAYISLTSQKNFRLYGTTTGCNDKNLLFPNNVSLY